MNRREWKRSRLTDSQIRNRRILMTVIIAAGIIAILAVVFVLLKPAIIRDKPDDTAATVAVETLPEDTEVSDTQTEPDTPDEPVDAAGENVAGDDAAGDDESGGDEAGDDDTGFDRTGWLEDHTEVRGLYVTGPVAGSSRMDDILELADSTDINAVVLDIKNDEGVVTFEMTSGTAVDIDACTGFIRDIDATLSSLKEHDLYVIGRIACFKDPILAEADPSCALLTSSGTPVTDKEGLAWVNPCNETVWEYLIELGEYCADLGFDEIQYDYVRFPVGDTAANADYGVENLDTDKHVYIEEFLKRASDRLHAKGIPVSADLFGTVIGNEIDVTMVGQDYAALSECVDAICPMVYPSHYGPGVYGLKVPDAAPYDTVYAALSASVEELSDVPEADRAVVRPWLQAFTATWVQGHISYGPDEIRGQIDAVEDAGYTEWILWNARNDYKYEGLEKPE